MGTRTALLDRVDRLGAEELTAKRLREQVLAALRQVLAYDAHVWLLTDPVTRVATSPLADVPGLPWSRLPELGRLRYLTRVNRWTDLMDARRRSALLLEATGGRPELSALWRDCLRELGVVDVAAMVCYDRFGCWAWLDLWRRGPASAVHVGGCGVPRRPLRGGHAVAAGGPGPHLRRRRRRARPLRSGRRRAPPRPAGARADRVGRRGARPAEPARRADPDDPGGGVQRRRSAGRPGAGCARSGHRGPGCTSEPVGG